MRLEIKPSDRLHMLVWKRRGGGGWSTAWARNSVPIEVARIHPTWGEALRFACRVVGPRLQAVLDAGVLGIEAS